MDVGGRITLLLAGEKSDTVIWGQQQPTDEEAGMVKKGPFIKAGAIAHATSVTREDFEGTKAPLAFICVENDQLFSEEIREYGENYLKENNVESEFKTYSGVPHGFAVTGDYEDASIVVSLFSYQIALFCVGELEYYKLSQEPLIQLSLRNGSSDSSQALSPYILLSHVLIRWTGNTNRSIRSDVGLVEFTLRE